jgi:hypothetical protein
MSQGAVDTGALDSLGPIEYLIAEFTAGHVPASTFHQFLELADRDLVRILDLEFVARDASGAVKLCDPAAVLADAGGELAAFVGASSGLLDAADVAWIGELVAPGNLAGIVVYENVWVAAMASRLQESGTRLVATGVIPAGELEAALDGAT